MATKITTEKPKTDAFTAVHSAGVIGKTTMRQYDVLCLKPSSELAAKDVKRIREHVHVSQPVFTRYLNTGESTVQKWEAGQKRPSGWG